MRPRHTLHPGELSVEEIAAWRAITAAHPAFASPLLGPDFALAVGAVRADARVAVWRRDGEAVGFLPHHLKASGLARPIGAPLSDYHALVSKAPMDVRPGLTEAGLGALRFTGLIDPLGLFEPAVRSRATAYVIKRQIKAGVSIVNDGEMSKPSYATYIKHRLSGFGGEAGQYEFADLEDFPGAKAQVFGNKGRAKRSAPACTAPIEVIDMEAPRIDAERLQRLARPCHLHVGRLAGGDRAVLPQPVLCER